MSCVDGFVVVKFVVANFPKFETVEVGALSEERAVELVLGIPEPGCIIDFFVGGVAVVVTVPLFFCEEFF